MLSIIIIFSLLNDHSSQQIDAMFFMQMRYTQIDDVISCIDLSSNTLDMFLLAFIPRVITV